MGKEHVVLGLIDRVFPSEPSMHESNQVDIGAANVCVLSETHETGAAMRLRDAFPKETGLYIVGSSRTRNRGGGVAILFRKDAIKFHTPAENEFEVVSLTSFLRKITIIEAYVTTSSVIFAGVELLRIAALRKIASEVARAKSRDHNFFLIGDLNLRPSEQQLAELDGNFKSARVPGFNFGTQITRDTLSIVAGWGLVLKNGLYSKAGLMTRPLRSNRPHFPDCDMGDEDIRAFLVDTGNNENVERGTAPDQIWCSDPSPLGRIDVMSKKECDEEFGPDFHRNFSDHSLMLFSIHPNVDTLEHDDNATTPQPHQIQWREWDRQDKAYNNILQRIIFERASETPKTRQRENSGGRFRNRRRHAQRSISGRQCPPKT